MPEPTFDAAAARSAGYSDGEIASFLASQFKFDADAAKKAGYDDKEIVDHLAALPPPTAPKAPAPASPPEPASPPSTETNIFNPSYASATQDAEAGMSGPVLPAGNAAIERIGKATAEGYNAPLGGGVNEDGSPRPGTQSFFTPQAQEAIDKYGGPIGQQIVNPAGKLIGGAIGAAHGGMAALAQMAMEVFGEKGGRDALALLSSIPVAETNQYAAMHANSPSALAKADVPTGPIGMSSGEPGAPLRYLDSQPRPESFPQSVPLSELDPRNAIQKLIEEQIYQDNPALAPPGTANQRAPALDAVRAIGSAGDVDGAIAAAGRAVAASGDSAETVSQLGLEQAAIRAMRDRANGVASAEEPVPQSVGAAASREQSAPGVADLSIPDMKANRRVAEMDEILAPPQANDTTIHVQGSFPTLAESSADPVVSQYENLLRQRNSSEFFGEGKRLTENNKARVAEFEAQTIPDTTLNTMRAKRAERWNAASADILPTARPADLTPAHDWVQEQLSNPRIQENDAVRSILEHFQDRLIDDNGNLKTDPAAVWGIHDNIQNQLAKAKDPLNMTGAEKFAEGQLITAKSLIDQAMNIATDNKFQRALAQYAEDSKAINSGVLLNDFRPRLTNMHGELQAQNFHNFVKNLAQERGNPGIDPSMDISDATMRSLINIDNDLKRAGLIKLGAAAGSPTNLLGSLAEAAGLDAAHDLVRGIPVAGRLLSASQKLLAQRKMAADTQRHLAPPPGGYRYNEAP